MMKRLIVCVAVAMVLTFSGSVMAAPKGKTVEFKGGAQGKVVFDGKVHAVNKCTDCHPKIFKMKKGSTKVTAPHKPGKFCATCHDGKKAFSFKDNCGKCHKK